MRGLNSWEYKETNCPDFDGRKVFVLRGAFYGQVVSMMARVGCEKAESVEDADLVVFVGGTDINPELYGQKPLQGITTYWDVDRDAFEKQVYEECIRLNKPMFGICRGAQFLHVMNGGTLWQDVENHGKPHRIFDIEDGCTVEANSMHHQAIIDDSLPDEEMEVIAICDEQVSQHFRTEGIFVDLSKKAGVKNAYETEVEAAYYPNTSCFVVQGHPEVGSAEYASWTLNKLYDMVVDHEDNLFVDDLNDSIDDIAKTAEKKG